MNPPNPPALREIQGPAAQGLWGGSKGDFGIRSEGNWR